VVRVPWVVLMAALAVRVAMLRPPQVLQVVMVV
jgi:hypothetical protein